MGTAGDPGPRQRHGHADPRADRTVHTEGLEPGGRPTQQSEFQRDLRMEGQNRDVVRVNALALPHAGYWLNAVPSTMYNLKMKTREFIPPVKFRLGMNQYRSEGKCPVCNDTSDARGDHSLNCGRGGGEMTARHHHLRNILHATAAAAHLNPSKEEQGIIPNCGDRPADVYIPGWKAGRDVAYDVTVINNLRGAMSIFPFYLSSPQNY